MKNLKDFINEAKTTSFRNEQDIIKDFAKNYMGKKTWHDFFQYLVDNSNESPVDMAHTDMGDEGWRIYLPDIDAMFDCFMSNLFEIANEIILVPGDEKKRYLKKWKKGSGIRLEDIL